MSTVIVCHCSDVDDLSEWYFGHGLDTMLSTVSRVLELSPHLNIEDADGAATDRCLEAFRAVDELRQVSLVMGLVRGRMELLESVSCG